MTELSVSLVSPIRVSMQTPQGFFIAAKPAGLKMLALQWGGKPYLFHLDGEYKFRFTHVGTGYNARGIVISDVEVRVDLSSRYDAVTSEDKLGALVIGNGSVCVVGMQAGDNWADPVEVPLWFAVNSDSAEEKVGFEHWKIVARDGDKRDTLWSSQEVSEGE